MPPDWVESKIASLARSSNVSFQEAASIIGKRGANVRHHKYDAYRAPCARKPVSSTTKTINKPQQIIQLQLGIQLPKKHYY